MPQYGVLVYAPAPADPMALPADHLERLNDYPEQAKKLGGKVLGGTYFPGQRGFAFEPSTDATSVSGDGVRTGPLVGGDLVVAAFYVVSAPNQDVAVEVAKLNPAVGDGGVEVRKLFVPETE